MNAMINKARVLSKRVEYDRHQKGWLVYPLACNKTTHIVWKDKNGWHCDCQRNRIMKKVCSHILAVQFYKKR